ncbi:flagellar basal-body rod protein FlgB [Hathewaya proteolytica DSM 3090]|uniref:Flagellar basal body rod protein FlgB n=1 Tax=Hathewaya proteolytica DSM 3090 TaxID=1121331 RepID=A0A1M6LB34_9CLOT|nr:flagellar basal body rod protein FlgB [Hathewaya proteolytica]SHJ68386.1 flagellar basal-body rod protein FlgB [Hathewaya proteolytica DSM 3090]
MSNGVNSIFNNNSYGSHVYGYIKDAMAASMKRDSVISNNIANVNTQGYKRFDVILKNNLKNHNKMEMKRTEEKHLPSNSIESAYEIKRDNSTSMKNDGNNVDVDSEMGNLAANAILYQSLVTSINNEFAMKNTVIRGGK